MKREVAEELIVMKADDERVRAELAADGSLFEGYHPRMRAVHERNADRLVAILAVHGWPASKEASDAAWLVVQHAISRPALMRGALERLRAPEVAGAVASWQLAMLEDRILVFEGRAQRFGTQLDWDEHGAMSPLPIADPHDVDRRRADVGLPPLAQAIADHRARTECERPPADLAARNHEAAAFAREVGWRG